MNGRSLFVRPEQFRLVREGGDALKGRVKAVYFGGSYNDVEVEVPGNIIRVRTTTGNYKSGDAVFVSLPSKGIWYMPVAE